MDQANALGTSVTIDLPGQIDGSAATYNLSRVAPNGPDATYEDANEYGDLDLNTSGSITIRGTGTPGPTVSISPNDRVFNLIAGTITIERVTITGGTARPGDNGVSAPGAGESVDGQDGQDGGCVLVASGVTATFDQVSINNCATSSGGNGAAPAAQNTTGGAAGDGGNGGAIANFGTLTLQRSFVYSNETGDAGSAANGTAGGGGAVAGGAGGDGGFGGGIYTEGSLTIEQSTITQNTGGSPSDGATGTNGGADGLEGEGGSGGGIALASDSQVSITGSIVADNTAGDDVSNGRQPGDDFHYGSVTASVAPDGYNLIGTNDSVDFAFPAGSPNANDSFVGTNGSPVDPMISGFNRNSTYAVTAAELASGSLAIDAGDPNIAGPVTDGRGFRRPGTASGDMTIDIGAFEFDSEPLAAQLVVNEIDSITTPADEDDGAEFVEIRNMGSLTVDLADYALVFFDGAGDTAYSSVQLSGMLAPDATITVGDTGNSFDLEVGPFGGASDDVIDGEGAIGIYQGSAATYSGATAGSNNESRIDVAVYNNADDQGSRRRDANSLASAFGQSQSQIASGDDDANSIQRNGNGTYSAGAPSPGANTMGGTVANVVINEVRTVGSAEFVELWDGGRGNTSLTGLVLLGVNGSNGEFYRERDLDGFTTDSNGYLVLGNVPNASASFALQNGPDAVALYPGTASDYTLGGASNGGPQATSAQPTDVVAYGNDLDPGEDILSVFSSADGVYATGPNMAPRAVRVQYNEDYNGASGTESLQRINEPSETDGYSLLFYAGAPTPGAANISEITVDETDEVADVEGWRMLSSPVISSGASGDAPSGTPLRVDFYAESVNLVQGVAAGTPSSQYQAQYPDGDDILFDEYLADGSYSAIEFASDELAPGTGFYWYWFDNDVQPGSTQFGGGTSRSFDLDGSSGFSLSVTGLPLDDRIYASTLAGQGASGLEVTKTAGQGGFVLIGNPYAYPYFLNAFTEGSGNLQTAFSAWDPTANANAGGYRTLTANANAPSNSNTAAVWQGLFAEVDGQENNSVTFTAPSDGVVPTIDDSALTGTYRTASEGAESQLQLTLAGMTAAGAMLGDISSLLRFLEDGTTEWDRHDGTKLTPITSEYALIAPVGIKDGEQRLQSALSLPSVFQAIDVPLALLAPAGDYSIIWEGTDLPNGFTGTLVDLEAATRTTLGSAGSYTFSVLEDTDWTNRFVLELSPLSVAADDDLEAETIVSAVYPNPAADGAALEVRLAFAQDVRVEVYDVLGRRVSVRDLEAASTATVQIDTADLTPGVYVVRVSGDGFQESRPLTVVR